MPSSPRPYRHGLAILALSLVGLRTAQAETYSWVGNTQSTDTWSTSFNWVRPGQGSGFVPVSSYDTTLLFTSSSSIRLDSRNNLGLFRLGNLTFGGRDGWTITGDGLDFATGTITADTSASVSNAISISSGLTTTVAAGKTLALSGAVSGAGSLIKSGAGILALSGAVTTAGGLTVNAGTVNVTGTLGASTAYVPTILSGGTLNLSNAAYVSNLTLGTGTTVTGAGALNLSGNVTFQGEFGVGQPGILATNVVLGAGSHRFTGIGAITGSISGSGGVSVGGIEDVDFRAANTYTGGTSVDGYLNLYATDALPKGKGLSMSFGALTINPDNTAGPITQTIGNLSGTGSVVIGGSSDLRRDLHNTLVLDASTYSTFDGILIGFGDFVKRGPATFEYTVTRRGFGGSDTRFLGRLNVEQGTMRMTGEQFGTRSLDIAAGATLDQSSAGLNVSLGFNGAGTLRMNGPLTLDNASGTFTGTISGAGALSMGYSRPDLVARPMVDLTGADLSGYTGAISVSNSTLSIANTTTNSTVSLTNGAILNVREDAFRDAASFGQVTGTTGTTLAKTGAGTLRVGNLNFGGLTRVDAGTLLVNRDTVYRSTDGIAVSQGATLGFGGGSAGVSTKTLTNAGTIVGSGGIVAAFTNGATGTLRTNPAERLTLSGDVTNSGTFNLVNGGEIGVAGKLTNAAGAFVTGQGTLTTGGLISSGTMAFSGGVSNVYGKASLLSGSVVQNSGGSSLTFWDDVTHNGTEIRTNAGSYTTFKGNVSGAGAFTGLGTVEFDGDLRPGNSPASVSFAGDLILANTNTLVMELGGTTLGTGYDHLNVGGTAYLDGMLNVVTYNGFNPLAGQSFDLFDFTGQRGTFRSVSLPTLGNNLAWNTSGLYTTGKISVQAVPEPASLAALAVGGLALLRRRKAKTA